MAEVKAPHVLGRYAAQEYLCRMERQEKARRRRRGFWRGVVLPCAFFVVLAITEAMVSWVVPLPAHTGSGHPQTGNGSSAVSHRPDLAPVRSGGPVAP